MPDFGRFPRYSGLYRFSGVHTVNGSTTDYGSGGWGFDSSRARQSFQSVRERFDRGYGGSHSCGPHADLTTTVSLNGRSPPPACVFQAKSASNSGMKSANDSDLISAIPM